MHAKEPTYVCNWARLRSKTSKKAAKTRFASKTRFARKARKNTILWGGAARGRGLPPVFLHFRAVRNTPPHLVAAGWLGGLVAGWWVGWAGWLVGWVAGWLVWYIGFDF